MPRISPYEIVLNADERRELEDAARKYTSPYREVVRARIILSAAEGLQNDAIASRLDTPRQIVRKWRKRFFEVRLDGLWEGRSQELAPDDRILSTDEKTSIQARRRIHATRPPLPGEPMGVEHEYERKGLGRIWGRGMCAGRRFMAVAKRVPGANPSNVLWSR